MMLLGSFEFYKMFLKSWYLQHKTKKKYVRVFQVFHDSVFFLEIFTTPLTMQCPKCIFHMDIYKDQVRSVTFVEKKVSRWYRASKNIYKKAPHFLWLPVENLKIWYIFYKKQNFQGTPWASIIATCLIKLWRTGPLSA